MDVANRMVDDDPIEVVSLVIRDEKNSGFRELSQILFAFDGKRIRDSEGPVGDPTRTASKRRLRWILISFDPTAKDIHHAVGDLTRVHATESPRASAATLASVISTMCPKVIQTSSNTEWLRLVNFSSKTPKIAFAGWSWGAI